MARILGIDLGSYSLKAVLIETTLRGYGVKEAIEVPIPREGDRLSQLQAGLGKLPESALADGHGLHADTVVVALPGANIATHSITLPFSDLKKIESTLPFELESQLPCDLDEVIFDSQMAASTESSTQMLVGVARKAEVGPLLAMLKEAKLDPRIVTHPALVYQNIFTQLDTTDDDSGAVMLLDIGHERVTVTVGQPGGPIEAARIFSGGGLHLNASLAKAFSIGLNEAETWKETKGALGRDVSNDAEAQQGAVALANGLSSILRELRPTLKAYTARSHRPVTRIRLCGGTSKLRGIASYFESELSISTKVIDLNDLPSASTGAFDRLGASIVQAFALAVRGQESGAKAASFNLRRQEFAFKSDLDFVKDKLGQIAAFGAVLLVLLFAGGVVKNSLLERRERSVDAALCDITKRVIGTCEKDYLRALAMMKGQEGPGASVPRVTAATLLAELTSKVPAEANVTIEQVAIDLDRISMKCKAGSSKQVDDLITSLKSHRCFKEVSEGKSDKSKDGSSISFKLDIMVDCPDDTSSSRG